MKHEVYKYPESSFLSIEKDAEIIISMLLKNNNLKRLLHYETKDCLKRPKLTEEQSLDLIGKNIKVIPKIYVDEKELNYLIITFNNFYPSENPEFRNNSIEFDILCHYDQWQLNDFKLRPYRIAAEIDMMFNNQRLTGIGKLDFAYAGKIVANDELAGICLTYDIVHGEEDKKEAPNPMDEENLIENFNEIFNE